MPLLRSLGLATSLSYNNTPYGKKVVEEQVRAEKHDRKGVNFFITFVDGHVKDVLAERFIYVIYIDQG